MDSFYNIVSRLSWQASKERQRQRELRELDYEIIYKAYTKYTLSIIDTARECLEFPTFDAPLVSIIIPVYNQYRYTMRCLQSILDSTDDVPYEIILGDDNSTDETKEILQHVKNIQVIKNTTQRGFLTNCNHAAQFAKGTYLYLLNNDTQVFPKTVSALSSVLDDKKEVAIVGSKCVKPNSKLQAAGSYWTKRGETFDRGQDDNPLKPEYNEFRYVDYCPGASLMIRRDFWEAEKGFDEQFAPGYYEETDLCIRARQRGFKVAYQPESEIIHFIGATFTGHKEIRRKNQRIFYKKWQTLITHQSLS